MSSLARKNPISSLDNCTKYNFLISGLVVTGMETTTSTSLYVKRYFALFQEEWVNGVNPAGWTAQGYWVAPSDILRISLNPCKYMIIKVTFVMYIWKKKIKNTIWGWIRNPKLEYTKFRFPLPITWLRLWLILRNNTGYLETFFP